MFTLKVLVHFYFRVPSFEVCYSWEPGSWYYSAQPEYACKSSWYIKKVSILFHYQKTKSCKLHLEYSLTSSFEKFLKLWLYKNLQLEFRSLSFLFNFSLHTICQYWKNTFLGYLTKLGAKSSWIRKGAPEENAASCRKHWSHQSSSV